jgi:hypothetical protein
MPGIHPALRLPAGPPRRSGSSATLSPGRPERRTPRLTKGELSMSSIRVPGSLIITLGERASSRPSPEEAYAQPLHTSSSDSSIRPVNRLTACR